MKKFETSLTKPVFEVWIGVCVDLDQPLSHFLRHIEGRIGGFDHQQWTLDAAGVGLNLQAKNFLSKWLQWKKPYLVKYPCNNGYAVFD